MGPADDLHDPRRAHPDHGVLARHRHGVAPGALHRHRGRLRSGEDHHAPGRLHDHVVPRHERARARLGDGRARRRPRDRVHVVLRRRQPQDLGVLRHLRTAHRARGQRVRHRRRPAHRAPDRDARRCGPDRSGHDQDLHHDRGPARQAAALRRRGRQHDGDDVHRIRRPADRGDHPRRPVRPRAHLRLRVPRDRRGAAARHRQWRHRGRRGLRVRLGRGAVGQLRQRCRAPGPELRRQRTPELHRREWRRRALRLGHHLHGVRADLELGAVLARCVGQDARQGGALLLLRRGRATGRHPHRERPRGGLDHPDDVLLRLLPQPGCLVRRRLSRSGRRCAAHRRRPQWRRLRLLPRRARATGVHHGPARHRGRQRQGEGHGAA